MQVPHQLPLPYVPLDRVHAILHDVVATRMECMAWPPKESI